MLSLVHRRYRILRATVAIIAALAVVIAGPIHAAHHHTDDTSPLHPTCAVCQLHSPACAPICQPCVRASLEPLFVLAATDAPSADSTPSIADACRAPPFFVA